MCARVQLTRFRPVASSQTPYPSFCLSGQKLSHFVAPPFPTKPTSLGFGGGPILHCFRRTRLYCSDCGENVGTERLTNLICSRKLGGCESASIFHGTRTPRALPTAMLKPRLRGAARRAHGSSAEHAMRDLIASNALRRIRRKVRTSPLRTPV